LTIGVDGNLKALKSAIRARVSSSRLRAGNMSSLTGHPESSIKFISSPLSVRASSFRPKSPNAESFKKIKFEFENLKNIKKYFYKKNSN
jgi:hypothetical protein